MDTDLAAVIGANIVAVSAIGVGLLQQTKTLKHERTLTDLASVRDVLVTAASVLHKAEYALDGCRLNLTQHGASFFENAVIQEPYKELGRVGKAMDEQLAELRVRLGPLNGAVVAFENVEKATLEIYRALGLLKMEDTDRGTETARRAISEFMDDIHDRVGNGRASFDTAQQEFFVAAHRAAGARLPAD